MSNDLPPFFDESLENRIQDSAVCPTDRFILVPPQNPPPVSLAQQFDDALDKNHPFRGKFGWNLCLVVYRRARQPGQFGQQQSIISVTATSLGTLGRSTEPSGRTKLSGMFLNTTQFILDENTNKAKLGPRGQILVDGPLRGSGIGSFCLSELIGWARAIGWSDAEVVDGKLGFGDAVDQENIPRRDRFYQGPGFDIDYHDDSRESGRFSKKRLGDLLTLKERTQPGKASMIESVSTIEAGIAMANFSTQAAEYERVKASMSDSLRKYRDQIDTRTRIIAVGALLIGIVLIWAISMHA